MKKFGFASFPVLFFATIFVGNAYAFNDPVMFDGHAQWNATVTERLRVALFGQYVIPGLSNIPVQNGPDKKYGGKNFARHEEGLQLQYRLLEGPAIGKIEMNLSVRIDTRDDAPDSLHRGPIEIAYTLPKNLANVSLDFLRVRLGFSDQTNIGNKAGSTREIGSSYVGLDIRLFDTEQWLVSFSSAYHFQSNTPSKVLDVYDGERKNPLRAEFGPQVQWRAHPFVTFVAAPSVYADDKFKPTMVGLKSGLQYDFGKQFFPNTSVSGLSWYVGEEYKTNIAGNEFMKKNAFEVFMGLRFNFKVF